MDTALAIEALVGFGVKYGGCTEFNTEKEFDDLIWEDERPRPKWSDLLTKWEEIKYIPFEKSELELIKEKVEEMDLKIKELESKIEVEKL